MGRSASGTALESLYLWFSRRLGQHKRRGRQAFSFGSSRTAWASASGLEERWRQQGRWRQVETASAAARASALASSLASESAAVIIGSEGVDVRDGSRQGRRRQGQRQRGRQRQGRQMKSCYVHGRRQRGPLRRVVGGSEGVGCVWGYSGDGNGRR